jgi:hypothetical protein
VLTTGLRHRVRPEATRVVSSLVLCGVMALFAGLTSVDASGVQDDVRLAPFTQTSVEQDWPAPPVFHAALAPADDDVCDEDDDDSDAEGRAVELAPLGRDALSVRAEALYTRIAALVAHADGQWLRAP